MSIDEQKLRLMRKVQGMALAQTPTGAVVRPEKVSEGFGPHMSYVDSLGRRIWAFGSPEACDAFVKVYVRQGAEKCEEGEPA